jgi:Mg-chelatase subunit ChlD
LNGVISLAGQKKKRKVIVIITDGQCNDDPTSLINEIRKSNVEVYCIGIHLSTTVVEKTKRIFGLSTLVNLKDANDLQIEIMKLAEVCL